MQVVVRRKLSLKRVDISLRAIAEGSPVERAERCVKEAVLEPFAIMNLFGLLICRRYEQAYMNCINGFAGNVRANSSGSMHHGAATIGIRKYVMNWGEYRFLFSHAPIDSNSSCFLIFSQLPSTWLSNFSDPDEHTGNSSYRISLANRVKRRTSNTRRQNQGLSRCVNVLTNPHIEVLPHSNEPSDVDTPKDISVGMV